jgi:phosphoribosyl-ATP pyrophosphohydrolase/phosphoribosyl-AMP cyclohydrolase
MGAPRSRALDPSTLRYGSDGLVAAVVQDAADGRVLMVAWQDAEAIEATLRTGQAHFHSRSRGRLWRKGETSGHTLAVVSMELDCDADAVLIRARPTGPTCHTGARSCFDEDASADVPAKDGPAEAAAAGSAMLGSPLRSGLPDQPQGFAWLEVLWDTIAERARTRPVGSYTSRLLDGGVDAVARKVAEEATEVVMAAKDDAVAESGGGSRPRAELAGELGDLLYHALVLCAERGLPPGEVIEILRARHGR